MDKAIGQQTILMLAAFHLACTATSFDGCGRFRQDERLGK
jgi:hypothetical protein